MPPEVVFFILVAALAAAIILWSLFLRHKRQEMRHQERMAALEKGAELPADPVTTARKPWSPRVYLLRGLVWLFSGIGLSVFLLGAILTAPGHEQSFQDRLWRAQDLRHRGATEDEVRQFLNSKEPMNKDRLPPGFALIGLIPAGVGLAYLIYYRGENKPEGL